MHRGNVCEGRVHLNVTGTLGISKHVAEGGGEEMAKEGLAKYNYLGVALLKG